MTSGGARNRSGPRPDPNSLRSLKRGVLLVTLPEKYDGPVPDLPLTRRTRRELQLWAEAWTTPQANAWAREPWRWRTVAMWVRAVARSEAADSSVSLIAASIRLADQIGLTPAGLRENGWAIARDELGDRRTDEQPEPARPQTMSARDRMKAAAGGGS